MSGQLSVAWFPELRRVEAGAERRALWSAAYGPVLRSPAYWHGDTSRITGKTQSDAAGRFRFEGSETGLYNVVAAHPEHVFFANQVPAPFGYWGFSLYSPERLGLDLPLEPGTRAFGVGQVDGGGPAAIAGLQARDVVVAIDGVVFSQDASVNDILDYLRQFMPGDVVTVAFYHGGEFLETYIEIGYQPIHDYNAVQHPTPTFLTDYLQAYMEFPNWFRSHFGAQLDESARQYSPPVGDDASEQ